MNHSLPLYAIHPIRHLYFALFVSADLFVANPAKISRDIFS